MASVTTTRPASPLGCTDTTSTGLPSAPNVTSTRVSRSTSYSPSPTCLAPSTEIPFTTRPPAPTAATFTRSPKWISLPSSNFTPARVTVTSPLPASGRVATLKWYSLNLNFAATRTFSAATWNALAGSCPFPFTFSHSSSHPSSARTTKLSVSPVTTLPLVNLTPLPFRTSTLPPLFPTISTERTCSSSAPNTAFTVTSPFIADDSRV